jgi:hypothetical protein
VIGHDLLQAEDFGPKPGGWEAKQNSDLRYSFAHRENLSLVGMKSVTLEHTGTPCIMHRIWIISL